MEALKFAIPLLVAVGVAGLTTPLVSRFARARHVVDRPNERKVSRRPDMPLLGGLAVAFGFAAGLVVALRFVEGVSAVHLGGLFLGTLTILALGICDDWLGLPAWPKVAVEIGAAAIAIACGFEIGHVTDPISRQTFMLPTWLSWMASVLWIVGITNAVNLIDGLDGLATGVGAIIGLTLAALCWQAGQLFGVFMGIALVGALLGFLPFNFSPARIFLGDTGSLFIGYLLSLVALEGYRQVTVLTFVVPLLALAVPILDTVLSVVRRIRLGTPIFTADQLHMHHRLLASEGSARNAVLQFYFLTACFCLIAVSFTRIQGYAAALFLVAVGGLTLRLLWNLGVLSLDRDNAAPAGEEKGR
jgi:UDP-GlcNAc:undecaprenyl-phosphate GlcNAc-1-phosphate transferase